MSTFLMTDWTFFTETKFAHTPVEVKSTRTNGTQMVGIKNLIHLKKKSEDLPHVDFVTPRPLVYAVDANSEAYTAHNLQLALAHVCESKAESY